MLRRILLTAAVVICPALARAQESRPAPRPAEGRAQEKRAPERRDADRAQPGTGKESRQPGVRCERYYRKGKA